MTRKELKTYYDLENDYKALLKKAIVIRKVDPDDLTNLVLLEDVMKKSRQAMNNFYADLKRRIATNRSRSLDRKALLDFEKLLNGSL